MNYSRKPQNNVAVWDLVDAGQFKRAEQVLKTKRPATPIMLICQAEVHTYFNRLDEAAEVLKRIEPATLTMPDGGRYMLARGEWHYWRFEYDLAQEHFHTADRLYRFIQDEFGQAKALCNLGRLKRRQAEFEEAQKLLHQALELMKDHKGQKKDFLQALIDFNLGVCAHEVGQLDAAEGFYSSAMVALNKLEHGMHYGVVLSSYGTLLRRNGKYEESLSMLEEAIVVLQKVAAFEPLGAAMNNKARTLIRLQRFEEAEILMRESLELHQRAGHVCGLSSSLQTLAELSLESQALREAEKYAAEAIEQADLSNNEFVKAEAHIALGRMALKRDDFYAAAKPLTEALELGEKLGSKMLQAAATLYLAECEFPTRPIKAKERLTEVRKTLEGYKHAWLEQEFERVSQRAQGDRMKVTPDNKLIIDGSLLPNWYAAKEAVETFLVKNALQQTGGNMTKAGKILGISKVHARDKKRKYKL